MMKISSRPSKALTASTLTISSQLSDLSLCSADQTGPVLLATERSYSACL